MYKTSYEQREKTNKIAWLVKKAALPSGAITLHVVSIFLLSVNDKIDTDSGVRLIQANILSFNFNQTQHETEMLISMAMIHSRAERFTERSCSLY
jgi:hypothetical protein